MLYLEEFPNSRGKFALRMHWTIKHPSPFSLFYITIYFYLLCTSHPFFFFFFSVTDFLIHLFSTISDSHFDYCKKKMITLQFSFSSFFLLPTIFSSSYILSQLFTSRHLIYFHLIDAKSRFFDEILSYCWCIFFQIFTCFIFKTNLYGLIFNVSGKT